jgi:two-component system, NtrC family, sensor histidine kinase GlrK
VTEQVRVLDGVLAREGEPRRSAAVHWLRGWLLRGWRKIRLVSVQPILPRTMAGLVALGCLLAATPLLLALLLTDAQLGRLARHSEQLIREGQAVVHLGSQLRDNINDLERVVRQYSVLRDPALAETVKTRLSQTESTLQSIEDQQLTLLGGHVLTAQRELVQIAKQWTEDQQQPEPLDRLARRIDDMNGEADAILSSGRSAIDAQVDSLRQTGAIARRVMLLSSIALIPLAALLAFAFSATVMRPLKQLRSGIVDLGHARYGQAIRIRFPYEMYRLGEQLDWLRQRLVQLEADKDRFLRHVSHELKTPLASLHEGIALLGDESLGPLTPHQQEVAGILRESTAELDGLIHNLLGYAQWRNEREQSAMDWFDAPEMVREVLGKHQWSMSQRHLRAEPRLHCERLFGHRSQLRLALENLLTNAIKHAPDGTSIEIDVAANEGGCELSVRDRGRGVAAHERRLIFEPFVRGTEAEELGARGTGIGLSIVQETILSHNGTVEVEDAEPGARFKMAWPRPLDGA